MKPVVIGRMGDGKSCAHRAIEERIQAAIQPVLARADRVLWELQNPRTIPGRHSDDFSVFWNLANPRMRRP